MTEMKRVYIETYGCQMNVADTDLIIGLLGRSGYTATDSPGEADVILVNTCAIRDNAEQRIYGRVGELKRYKRPGDVMGIVGCMAQRLGRTLLDRVPHVDFVAGPDGYRMLSELILRAGDGERSAEVGFKSWEHYEDVPPVPSNKVAAFVTVQRGCNYRCTFCVVPMTRGPERSRKLADVVREVERVAASGTTEVTLLGQTVNSYHDGVRDFADLLRAVGEVDGIRRVRFTSPHPNDFSHRVIEAMAQVPEVCEHVHLPMQSGSSRVLKRMLRRYTRESYLECVDRLRAAVPDLAITTDIIVGFPGETEDDFLALWCVRCSSTTRSRSNTQFGMVRRRSKSGSTFPTSWLVSASNASSARYARLHGARTPIWWGARTRSWWRRRPGGGACCSPARVPTRSCSSKGRPKRSDRIAWFGLPGPPGRRLPVCPLPAESWRCWWSDRHAACGRWRSKRDSQARIGVHRTVTVAR